MDGNAKQLLSERIKNATNILVTVSRDPSVDELSAGLALTLMLNKMDKHATAVFSGTLPPAIEFLQPEKTFEGTVDSLRDFIIALDKEKADRLRYKVEDDVVRIFITPYRTTISEKDLQFSQGDFNVELIVALGVERKEDLDNAITAHGRILHDATVVTVNAGDQKSALGSIDWSDSAASSLCEMLMSLSESLQSGLLDQQISTALLTGIVAATERFSNTHTSPRVMTMAAQLMAAGANQQLIATKLEEGSELPASESIPDGSKKLTEGESHKVAPKEQKASDGEMHIEHDEPKSDSGQEATEKAPEPAKDAEKPAQPEEKLSDDLAASLPAPVTPNLSVDDLKKDLAAASQAVDEAASSSVSGVKGSGWRDRSAASEPSFGGTLNATADEAAADKRREQESKRNHKLLSHDAPSGGPADIPLNGAMANGSEPPSVDPFAEPPKSEPDAPLHYEPTPLTTSPPAAKPVSPPAASPSSNAAPQHGTLLDLEQRAHAAPIVDENSSLTDARAAVDAALGNAPFNPAHQPLQSTGATAFPPVPHDDSVPAPATPPANPALPLPPPLPDFSTLPPLPADPAAPSASSTATPPASPPSVTPPPHVDDPGEFKLPGQS